MTFSFHPRAEQELDKAVRYYEECSSGLGLEFAEEVYAAIARIIAYATVEQLVVLSNLESLNAVLIRQALPQSERLAALNAVAITQLTSLAQNRSVKKLK
jgi:NAD(P)-dependent dehydrogenase (short-subunit alcohol dehydrogenase family)